MQALQPVHSQRTSPADENPALIRCMHTGDSVYDMPINFPLVHALPDPAPAIRHRERCGGA